MSNPPQRRWFAKGEPEVSTDNSATMNTLRRPAVVAHRGASASHVENTLAAFDAAVAQGADAIELDIRWTRDTTAVVFHDPAIFCHGRKSPVGKLSAEEFIRSKAQDGVRVPTLREILLWGRDKPPLVFDIKDTRREEVFIAELEEHGFHPDSVFSSFRLTVISRIKSLRPSWRTAWIIGNNTSAALRRFLLGPIITRAMRWGVGALHFHHNWIESEVIARCHGKGLNVAAWTVDDADHIRRVAEFGVDAIITNAPDTARRALER